MFLGMDTVKGCVDGLYSVMTILVSSSSGSAMDDAGEEAVEDDVRMDSEWPSTLREFMTVLHNSLYTRRAPFLLFWSNPGQEQNCGWNCCASLPAVGGTRLVQEPEALGGLGAITWWTVGLSRR